MDLLRRCHYSCRSCESSIRTYIFVFEPSQYLKRFLCIVRRSTDEYLNLLVNAVRSNRRRRIHLSRLLPQIFGHHRPSGMGRTWHHRVLVLCLCPVSRCSSERYETIRVTITHFCLAEHSSIGSGRHLAEPCHSACRIPSRPGQDFNQP